MKKGLKTIRNLILLCVALGIFSLTSCGDQISDTMVTLEDNADNDLNKLFNGGTNFLHDMKNFFVSVANGNKNILEKLNDVSDTTCMDELINQKNSNILEDIDNLYKYLELSEKLNELNLKEISTSEINTNCILLSVEEIENLIEQYNKDKSNATLFLELKNQERCLNNYICQKGNSCIAEFYDLLLRAKLADSYGFNTDISLMIANSIEIPSKSAMQYNTKHKVDSIAIGDNSVKLNEGYKGMLNNLYLATDYTTYENYTYDKNINNELKTFMTDALDYIDDDYHLKIK